MYGPSYELPWKSVSMEHFEKIVFFWPSEFYPAAVDFVSPGRGADARSFTVPSIIGMKAQRFVLLACF